MTRVSAPLFRLDPGWLFVAAGLAVCVAGVLTPAQHDLTTLRQRLHELQRQETYAYAQLRAYSDFLDQLERGDRMLFSRLAAAQLNMMPEGYEPVLLTSSVSARITDWIDASIQIEPEEPAVIPTSRLTSLASGPHRLWVFAGSVLCVFIGLLLGPDVAPAATVARRRRSQQAGRRDRSAELAAEARRNSRNIVPVRPDPLSPAMPAGDDACDAGTVPDDAHAPPIEDTEEMDVLEELVAAGEAVVADDELTNDNDVELDEDDVEFVDLASEEEDDADEADDGEDAEEEDDEDDGEVEYEIEFEDDPDEEYDDEDEEYDDEDEDEDEDLDDDEDEGDGEEDDDDDLDEEDEDDEEEEEEV